MTILAFPMPTTSAAQFSDVTEHDEQPPPTSHSLDRQDNDPTDALPPSNAALDPRHHNPPEDPTTHPAEVIPADQPCSASSQALDNHIAAGHAWVEDIAAAQSSYEAAEGPKDIQPRAQKVPGVPLLPSTTMSHYLPLAPHRTTHDGKATYAYILPRRDRASLTCERHRRQQPPQTQRLGTAQRIRVF